MDGEKSVKRSVEEKVGEKVVAAAALSQGTPPSMLSMVTGAALIKLVSPRACKELPKRFLLAVTPSRVIALKGMPISDEDGRDLGARVGDEVASWGRGEVSASVSADGKGGQLRIPGAEVPVFDRTLGSDRERELFEALGAR